MKTAIYIEDGTVQLVITPETDFEKNALTSFQNKELETKLFSGTFYDCRGGWVRQEEYYTPMHGIDNRNKQSLILRIKTDKVS